MTNKITLIKKLGTNPKTKQELYYGQVKTHKIDTYDNLQYEGSGITEDTINHALSKLVKGMKQALLSGEGFKIEGLGTFKIKVKSASKTNAKELTVNDVKYNGIQFLVDKDLKKELSQIKFEFESVKGTSGNDSLENLIQPDSREEVE